MEKKTFYGWMMTKILDNIAAGDLGRDMKANSEISKTAKTLAYYRRYMKRMEACDGAFYALERAWADWEKYRD